MTVAVPDSNPVERFRQDLPAVLTTVGQIVVDNPRPLMLTAAGVMVLTKVMANAMRPRTPVEALALLVVTMAIAGWGTEQLVDRGILQFRVRDEKGCLVPLVSRADDSASAK